MKKYLVVSGQQSAKGPDPAIVGKIWERVADWIEEQSTTEKVYQPIVDHGEAHRVAIENMTKAMAQGDNEAMQKYFDEARYHKEMQRQAGVEARKYFLAKAQVRA